MPFTIAHSVTARPIARLTGGRLVVPALAVGAMAPDFEYLAHLSATRTIGHTFPGVFLLCLPAGLVALLLWYRLLGPVLAQLLRPGTGGLTAGWGEASPFGTPGRLALVCLSIVIGSFSHIAWDSFTHQGGAVVSLWSGFRHRIGPGPLPVYQWLQYGCSVLGMALLGAWAHRAAQRPHPLAGEPGGDGTVGLRDGRRAPGGVPQTPRTLSRARWTVAGAVAGGVLLVGAIGAVQGAAHSDPYAVLRGAVIGALAGAVVSLLLSCAAVARRPGTGVVLHRTYVAEQRRFP
jgi:membrane-bound metal-dependent hydrolase YbcI (DUF457 family)